ncbi:MAG: non-ribosomal peptide synthetase, partial [bacterium]|nr:non-ribosomal peptide synthetase [bacterium]
LDEQERVQPLGVPGELCISGLGPARGYLNNPELTAEKFRKNPYSQGERMYKTGDLAKWLPDGNIELLGRIDLQVKIRGTRLELEEVEHRLSNHDAVKEAVVTAKEGKDGEMGLIAYYVRPEDTKDELNSAELRVYLGKTLPEYMIPSGFFQIERIPLTVHGKIDRKGLEANGITGKKLTAGTAYTAPENQKEKIIAAIWEEVLAVEKVGIHDNFFDIGGNSFKAIQLNNKLNAALGTEISVAPLFEHVTINSFVRYLSEKDAPPDVSTHGRHPEIGEIKRNRSERKNRRMGRN